MKPWLVFIAVACTFACGCPDPSCDDHKLNQTESDVDCGGGSCKKCELGKRCTTGSDCQSNQCTDGHCAPTCTDKLLDQDETDVDCGGATCSKCENGKSCATGSDCRSQQCTAGHCAASCTDGVLDQDETDIDCGGATCPKCEHGKICASGPDCRSLLCTGGQCIPTCTDGVRNQDETDVDCGGAHCGKCAVGLGCSQPGDCVSALCGTGADPVCECPAGMGRTVSPHVVGACIDQVEVTAGEYKTFLDLNADTAPLRAECQTHGRAFVPVNEFPPANESAARLPVRFVDWCDADAYCASQGKHLCGRGGGNATPPDQLDQPSSSVWLTACTQGSRSYCYGADYQPDRCNGNHSADGGAVATPMVNGTSTSTCSGGPLSNIYDLSGNVAEWDDACEGNGPTDNCLVRGGSFRSLPNDLTCAARSALPRNDNTKDYVGIRCCMF